MSLFNNFLHNTNNVNNQHNLQNQIYSDYPEVFYTNGHEQNTQSIPNQNTSSPKNFLSNLGLSKNMIGQFLPLLFGKGGGTGSNNILASLLQNGFMQGENGKMAEIFSILNQSNNQSKNIEDNKKDMPNIIDMSDYIEIKS